MAEESTKAPQSPISFDAPSPVTPAGGDGRSAAAPGAMTCAKCASPIGAYYYEAAGAVYCARCKRAIEEATVASGGFGRGALFGLGAALLGALGYFAFMKITGRDWALISIAVGAFIATAIRKGNGGRGSRRFQFLAVALTYLAIGAAYAPIFLSAMDAQTEKEAAASPYAVETDSSESAATTSNGASETSGTAVTTDSSVAQRTAAARREAERFEPIKLAGALLLLTVLGPIMTVWGGGFPGSLISLAIIGFALVKAWQMTSGAAAATGGAGFTGPYKVGARETAA